MSDKKSAGLIMMLAGASSVGLVGALSSNLNAAASKTGCKPSGVSYEKAGTASMVALGSAFGIGIHAISNANNLMGSEHKVGLLLLLITTVILILGGILVSLGKADGDDEEIRQSKIQNMLNIGGIMIGASIGIFIPALLSQFNRMQGTPGFTLDPVNMRKQTTAVGSAILALLATIVGSWSWNGYNRCSEQPANGLRDWNAIFTVVSALFMVYCVAYTVQCTRGNCTHSITLLPQMLKARFGGGKAAPE